MQKFFIFYFYFYIQIYMVNFERMIKRNLMNTCRVVKLKFNRWKFLFNFEILVKSFIQILSTPSSVRLNKNFKFNEQRYLSIFTLYTWFCSILENLGIEKFGWKIFLSILFEFFQIKFWTNIYSYMIWPNCLEDNEYNIFRSFRKLIQL